MRDFLRSAVIVATVLVIFSLIRDSGERQPTTDDRIDQLECRIDSLEAAQQTLFDIDAWILKSVTSMFNLIPRPGEYMAMTQTDSIMVILFDPGPGTSCGDRMFSDITILFNDSLPEFKEVWGRIDDLPVTVP